MRIAGHLTKQGKFWGVEIPLLNLDTQGNSLANALVMAKDVIEEMVDRDGFSVEIIPFGKRQFIVDVQGRENSTILMAFALGRQRELSGLSQSEVAKRMKFKSAYAYQKYELGETQPSLDKFFDMLNAMNIDHKFEHVITTLKVSGE